MKSKILLLALIVALFTSCTTSYKTGQTPDDVYYSPTRPDADEYVKTDKKQDRNYRYDEEYYEDQYLRMKVRDRYRWSEIDDPYYYRSRYNYTSYNCSCFSNPWSPSVYWNSYYNPYYQNHVYINPKSPATYTGPRVFNLNSYNNNAITNNNYNNPKYNNGSYNSNTNNTYTSPRYSPRNNNENSGNILRDIFNSSGNSNNSSSGSSPKTSSSSGSSSSSSSSNSSSAPVRKF